MIMIDKDDTKYQECLLFCLKNYIPLTINYSNIPKNNCLQYIFDIFLNSNIDSDLKLMSGLCVYKAISKWQKLWREIQTYFWGLSSHLIYLLEIRDFEVWKTAMKIACCLWISDYNITALINNGFLKTFEGISQKYELRALFNISSSTESNVEAMAGNQDLLREIMKFYDYWTNTNYIWEVSDILINLAERNQIDAILYWFNCGLFTKIKYILEKDWGIHIQGTSFSAKYAIIEKLLKLILTLAQKIPEESKEKILDTGLGEVIESVCDRVSFNLFII